MATTADHYETGASVPQALQCGEQGAAQCGGCDYGRNGGCAAQTHHCNGRLDPTAWDGLEDTDPALDLSQWDAPSGGPMAYAIRWDAGDEHPDLPQRMRLAGAL